MDSCVLVPTDFSLAANKALDHAIYFAKKSGAKVYLVHLCKSVEEIKAAKDELDIQVKSSPLGTNIESLVRVGTYKDIPTIGSEISAEFIFMGTHGTHGFQKLFGSNALKIVNKSEVPFIIVQEDSPKPIGYDKLLITSSFRHENPQKIKAVGVIAKYFNSEVCFIYNDADPIVKEKSLNNIKNMGKHLDKLDVKHKVESSSSKNFNSDTIALAVNENSNLIAIMNMQKEDVLGNTMFGANYEQELIMNSAKIPVLIINPNNNRLFTKSTVNIFNA